MHALCVWSISKHCCCYWSIEGGCCRRLERCSFPSSFLFISVADVRLRKRGFYFYITVHVSLFHKHALISLPTYFIVPMCSPSLLPSTLLFLHRLLPIITCSPYPLPLEETQWVTQALSFSSSLTLAFFHLSSPCMSFLPVLSHCLILWIPLNSLLPHWLAAPDRITSCYLFSSSFYVSNFCCDLKMAAFAWSISLSSSQPFSLKATLHFFFPPIDFLPPHPFPLLP